MIDFVPIWAAILAFAVFMYVLLDGFDLGIGILFFGTRDEHWRDVMMSSAAPVWDGNETWLVFGMLGLLAAFPLAFAILLPALYFPLLFMLMALIFRGVAFEFRFLPGANKQFWGNAFHCGSLLATFFQGVVLGNFVAGIPVVGRQFAGDSFFWLRPFSLFTGVGLVFGYALLGSCWILLKTEGDLRDWARRQARICLVGVLAFIAMVSVWTPWLQPRIYERWFSWPNIALLSPVPIITAALGWGLWRMLATERELPPFLIAMGLFVMCYLGLGISIWPMVVPYQVSLNDAAAASDSQQFLLPGTLFLLPIILAYTAWSYWIFRGKISSDFGYLSH